MNSLHKYNISVSAGMFLITMLNVLTIKNEFIFGLTLGYIYSCFWTYVSDPNKNINDSKQKGDKEEWMQR